jgi:glutamine amidotransferase
MSEIIVIDYGVGNVASIANMLKKANHTSVLTADHELIRQARKLILPGVGSFDHAAARLQSSGLDGVIREQALSGTPILGVCLGMQLLLDGSDEGELSGLGLIPGRAIKFPTEVDGLRLRVPHMGWNTIERVGSSGFPGVESNNRFYFVHSYYAKPINSDHVLATTRHGIEFASMIHKGNVFGVQFHPEKSHRFGLRLLTDFAETE